MATDPKEEAYLVAFARLVTIMDELRVGCPWDREQTLETLRPLTIEETYELSEAILDQQPQELAKELGDLFLHLVFYAKIGSEQGLFTLDTVLNGICDKLIRRHPHIYGDVVAEDSQQVKANWEQLKLKEGERSVLGGVPKGLPALVKAWRIQEKAAGIGFDWPDSNAVATKVREEFDELSAAESPEHKAEEMGDLLFVLVNYARHLNINPDDALEAANRKFIRRFQGIETLATERGTSLSQLDLAGMDLLWDEVKRMEKG